MDCSKVKENAEEYLNNELQAEEMSEIKNHLEKCIECRRFFKDLKNLFCSYPDYEKKFSHPRNLEEKLKKSLEDLEKIPTV